MISIHFQGKPFNIMVIQVYAPTNNAEEAEVKWFYENLQYFLELNPKKYIKAVYPFHYRGLECKSRKSGNTWSIRQVWPWSTKWSRAKVNRVLWRERTRHSKHPLPTMQERTLHMDITKWSISKIRLILFFTVEDGEALYSQQKQDQELTVAQIMNSLLQNLDLNWWK